MKIYYPALATGALFTSLLILDLSKQQIRLFMYHFIFAIIAVVLMVYLSQKDADFVAWGILAFPLLLLVIGILIGYYNPVPGSSYSPQVVEQSHNRCSICNEHISRCCCKLATVAATPAASSTVTCGDNGNGGKTPCIDTSTLASA